MNLSSNASTRLLRNLLTFTVMYILLIVTIVQLVPSSADYPNYFKYFNGIGGERFAIGFKTLIDFFKLLEINEFLVVWFFVTFITLVIKLYIVYKIKKKNILLFLILYGFSYFFLHESIQIRACIGLTFAFLSLYLYSESKYFLGTLSILFGSLFHSSVLIFLIALFVIFFIRKNILIIGYILAISVAVYIFLFFDLTILSVFNPLVKDYVKYAEFTQFNLFSVSLLLAYIFIFFGILNYKNTNYFGKIIFNFYLLLMIAVITFSSAPVISIRIGDMMNVLPYFYIITFDISSKLRYILLLLMLIIMTLHKFLAFMFFFPIFFIN